MDGRFDATVRHSAIMCGMEKLATDIRCLSHLPWTQLSLSGKISMWDALFRSKGKVKRGEWNRLEIVSDMDTLEMFLNGESAGKVRLLQPGRSNSNCWFGGRPKELFKGSIRDIRIRHGR